MKKNVVNIICFLIGAFLTITGANKLFPLFPIPDLSEENQQLFEAFATIGWIMPLVGLAEMIGGILVCFSKTRIIGAMILLPITVGIVLHHLVHDPAGLPIAFIVAAFNLWLLFRERAKLLQVL